jgi:hypothetical protein
VWVQGQPLARAAQRFLSFGLQQVKQQL